MKRCLIAFGALAVSTLGLAQSAYDALSMNQLDPIMGTARYSSMAGAFGALGGNPSVSKDNPAGIGLYKCFDLSFTPNLYLDNDKDVNLCLNNFSLVINFKNHEEREKGYITSSLGITYNRLRNFSRYTSIGSKAYGGGSLTDDICSVNSPDYLFNEAEALGLVGYDENGDAGSLFSLNDKFSKSSKYVESGHAGEWDFSYGMNISNRIFWGASLGVTSLEYRQKALYDETSLNRNKDYFYYDNYYNVIGVGVNFKAGILVKATDFLRVGAAIHTPTFYDIDESASVELDYNDQNPEFPEIDRYDSYYHMTSPFKVQGSVGFVIAKRALIGLEYNLDDYSSMRMKKNDMKIEDVCEVIDREFTTAHTLKLGAEFKVIDQFALRAGYALMTSPMKYDDDLSNLPLYRPFSLPQNTHYITAGLGYEGEHFYFDLAYVFRNQAAKFFMMLPQPETACDLNLKNHNISASFGWRF